MATLNVPAALADNPVDDSVFVAAARELLQHRADVLVSGKVTTHDVSTYANGEIRAGQVLRATEAVASAQLEERKDRLAAGGEQYTGARTEVSDVHVTHARNRAELRLTEITTLDYAKIHGDEPPVTSYETDRLVTFERVGKTWTLTGQQMLGEGIAPVTDVSPRTTGSPAVKDADTATPAQTARPTSTTSDKVLASMNYQAAADYAVRHVHNYNPNYRTFNDVGGDCTNFISQALRAGGWTDVPGYYKDYHYWWYNWANQTYSWTSVPYWASFALTSGRTYNLGSVWHLGLADILQMDSTSNGSKDHSMIVSYRPASSPYLSYHSQNTLNRSMQSILDGYRSATFYAFRT